MSKSKLKDLNKELREIIEELKEPFNNEEEPTIESMFKEELDDWLDEVEAEFINAGHSDVQVDNHCYHRVDNTGLNRLDAHLSIEWREVPKKKWNEQDIAIDLNGPRSKELAKLIEESSTALGSLISQYKSTLQ